MALFETFLSLLLIGWLLFLGYYFGKSLEDYIEDKSKKAAKRENQNKEGQSK
ncbi:MAG TPA: hypothetical protein PKA41_13595 [Verrucomicrobiota bacterium]|nr:hypothetical protein [Verrucomicrobiota bacterium]